MESATSVSSQSQLCPPWTYHKYNSSDCVCGDSVNGIVICNEPSSEPTAFCGDTPLSVCLLTCYCMSYSEKFDTIILGECPFLCTSHYYYRIPNSSDQLDTTCSTVIVYKTEPVNCVVSALKAMLLLRISMEFSVWTALTIITTGSSTY